MAEAAAIAAAWASLSPEQQGALVAAEAAGKEGLTGATHPVEFSEGPRLEDHGYVVEVTIGSLVLTEHGREVVAYGQALAATTTEEIEERG